MTEKKATKAAETRAEAEPLATPVPATQEKPTAEYADEEPITKAPTRSGTAAFDGEEGLRARNATMEPGPLTSEGQTRTASKAKRG